MERIILDLSEIFEDIMIPKIFLVFFPLIYMAIKFITRINSTSTRADPYCKGLVFSISVPAVART